MLTDMYILYLTGADKTPFSHDAVPLGYLKNIHIREHRPWSKLGCVFIRTCSRENSWPIASCKFKQSELLCKRQVR